MPWKDTSAMEERVKFVIDYSRQLMTMTELCASYDISCKTGYKWLKRYRQAGLEALKDWNPAPLSHPNQTPPAIEEAIVACRQEHRHWGPKKLQDVLKTLRPGEKWPAPSTIGGILKRHGLVKLRKLRRRVPAPLTPLDQGSEPNEVWAADFKGWFRTTDGTRIDPLTVSDHASRYLLLCQALRYQTGSVVKSHFEALFRTYGLPQRIRTDNGTPFASVGLAGLSTLSVWWIRLGIFPERIRPGKPQDNGRHERMHRTLKQETAQPPQNSLDAQQCAFDVHRRQYNEERPHEALAMKRPSQCYRASARVFPNRLPELEYPSHFQLRHVRSSGDIKWHCTSVYLSEALLGQTVGLHQTDDHLWTIYFGPLHLGQLNTKTKTLEPTTKTKVLPMCPD